MKNLHLLIVSLASASTAFAADIDINSGQLENILSGKEIAGATELRLTGTMDARDFASISNLPSGIKSLDLSGISVESLTLSTRKYFGRTLFTDGEIPEYTFFKSGVENLILPLQLSKICNGAFAASSLTSIEIPEGVTTIGDYAFYGCKDLVSVKLPSSLVSIGKGAFGNCVNLTAVDMSESAITEIPERAFAGAVMLDVISLPPTIGKIGREAFSHTAIKSLDLSTVSEFESFALSGMPFLEHLSIAGDAVVKEGLLMDDISLLSLEGTPENIPDYFAANCFSLDTHDLISGSLTVGKYAFANQNSSELILSPGLVRIQRGALSGISNLIKIDVTALANNIPEVDDTTFEGIEQAEITLFVDDDHFDIWNEHPEWGKFLVKSEKRTDIADIDNQGEAIQLTFKGNLLSARSSSEITELLIFSSDGKLLHSSHPGTNYTELSTDFLSSGILLLSVKDAEGNVKRASMMVK